MEENKSKEAVEINGKDEQSVNGGRTLAGYSGGYCPYTPDRNCKIAHVGNWDPNNEDCKYCGYVAW